MMADVRRYLRHDWSGARLGGAVRQAAPTAQRT
jgi:hypothetical protein